jgi:hypothetical protein
MTRRRQPHLSGLAPQSNQLRGYARKVGSDGLRLGQPKHWQGSIPGPGYQCSRATNALRPNCVPNVGCDHAYGGWGDIQFLGHHVVHLWRGFEPTHSVNAKGFFEPAINAGML